MKREEIEHLGTLARIGLTDAEADALASDISSVLEYVSDINEIATQDTATSTGALQNVMREDGEPHESGVYTEDLLAEAPTRHEQYIQVKKILKNDSP